MNSFRCPACFNHPLVNEESELRCPKCKSKYPIINGCPVLLDDSSMDALEMELESDTGRSMMEEYSLVGAESKPGGLNKLIEIIKPPQVLYDYNPDLKKNHTLPLFDHAGEHTSILNVGGGPRRYSAREVTMNLRPFFNVDVVGDAHNIPFMDNTFDTIISVAVLEHVHNPVEVVAEMYRVLKPGGLMYAEIPFVFFFHGYPNDFTRYTREGMKRLFSNLYVQKIGMTQGPMSSGLQNWNIVLETMIPIRFKRARKLFNGIYRWMFFWLKYIDKFLENNPDAHRVAPGFYVLGRKPAD